MKPKKIIFFVTNYRKKDIICLFKKYRSIKLYYIDCNNKRSINKLNSFFLKKRANIYLISFSNGLIFTKKLLKNIDPNKSINFHPATPKYRGRDVSHFACYFKEKYFGGTMHLINNKIDKGKIIEVKKYKLKINPTHYEYTKIGHRAIKFLLKKNLKNIINDKIKTKKIKWGNMLYTRKMFLKKLEIQKNFSKKNLDHLIKSFYTKEYKSLYFKNKNDKIYLKLN